jgi:hypothetical protein
MSQAQRLSEAQRLVEQPEELASDFAASVAQFEPYANLCDHFYPPERAKRSYAEQVKRTNDLVLRPEAQKEMVPVDSPHRLRHHDAGSAVTTVPATALVFDYVDRELLVQRTTKPAEWEDGKPNLGGVRLDVLLVDRDDRTPIVGELKSRTIWTRSSPSSKRWHVLHTWPPPTSTSACAATCPAASSPSWPMPRGWTSGFYSSTRRVEW